MGDGQSKAAGAYWRDGKISICATSQMVTGAWLSTAPFFKVDENDPILSAVVLEALSFSTTGIPTPETWKKSEIFRKELGLRSFARPTKHVGIQLLDVELRFDPSRNIGRGRFSYISGETVRCKMDAQDLGAHLKGAFHACS